MAPRRRQCQISESQRTLYDFWPNAALPSVDTNGPNAPHHSPIATNTPENTRAGEIDVVPGEPAPLENPGALSTDTNGSDAPHHPPIATNTPANTLAGQIDVVPGEPVPLETPGDVIMEDGYCSDEPRIPKRHSKRQPLESDEEDEPDDKNESELDEGNEPDEEDELDEESELDEGNEPDEEDELGEESELDEENEPDEENESDGENESDKENLPAEFSLMNTGGLENKFRMLVMRLVYLIHGEDPVVELEPCFTSADHTFNTSIYGLRDGIAGQVSGWGSDFKTDLDRFPNIDLTISKEGGFCVACRRFCSKVYKILLYGEMYDPKTLMFKSPTNSNTVNSVTYIAGPTCSKRSGIYHKLHHLKWWLFNCVKNKVDMNQMGAEYAFGRLDESFIERLWSNVESIQSEAEKFNRSGAFHQDEDDLTEILENSSMDI